jgi:hypothetical protein
MNMSMDMNMTMNEEMQAFERQVRFYKDYETSWTLYRESMFPLIVGKIAAEGIGPVTMVRLRFGDSEGMTDFLEESQFLLGDKVLCFARDTDAIDLIFLEYKYRDVTVTLDAMSPCGGVIELICHSPQGGDHLWDISSLFVEEDMTEMVEEPA